MAITRCLFPDSVTGRGPITSTASHSMGEATLYCAIGAQIFLAGLFPMHTNHRMCTRPPYPCDIGTSRISHTRPRVMHSKMAPLCYGGHEPPVISVSLGVVAVIFACYQQDSPKFGTRHPLLDMSH